MLHLFLILLSLMLVLGTMPITLLVQGGINDPKVDGELKPVYLPTKPKAVVFPLVGSLVPHATTAILPPSPTPPAPVPATTTSIAPLPTPSSTALTKKGGTNCDSMCTSSSSSSKTICAKSNPKTEAFLMDICIMTVYNCMNPTKPFILVARDECD